MRVTDHITHSQAHRALQDRFGQLNEAQQRASTGKRVTKASDDSLAIARIMDMRGQQQANKAYKRSLDVAQTRLEAEDTVFAEVTDSLGRAKELAASQVGDNANSQTRLAVKAEVDQLFEAAIGLANRRLGSVYLFGGYFAEVRPFDDAGNSSPTEPPVGDPEIRIGSDETVKANHDGQTAFIDSNVFDAFRDLAAGLGANDSSLIANAMQLVDTAIDRVQGLIAETGARQLRIDHTRIVIEQSDIQVEADRSRDEDADLSKVVVDMASRQVALESALYATSQAVSITIVDFLS